MDGGRVQCPLCGASIRIAGVAKSKSDDDDWLNLDEPAPTSAAVAPSAPANTASSSAVTNRGTVKTPASSNKPLSEADLDDFMLPDLAPVPGFRNGLPPELEMPAFDFPSTGTTGGPSAPSGPLVPELSSQDLAMLRGVGLDNESESDDQSPAPVKQVVVAPKDLTYRVKCPVCESLSYARPNQAGKQIRCGDCHSVITVPPPPKPKVKYEPNIEEAKPFAFQGLDEPEAARPADPFRKSADQYLAAAEKAIEETEPETSWDLPPISLWLTNVLRIMRDPALIGQWMIISAVAAVPAAIAVGFNNPVVWIALFIGGFLLTSILVASGFAILEAVANDEKQVSEWPIFDIFAWYGPLFTALAAAGLAAAPLGIVLNFLAPGFLAVAGTMFSIYLLYPFVLLSMLDTESILQPFSASVSKSVTRSGDHWMMMYTVSGFLFFGLFVVYLISAAMPPAAGVVLKIFATSAAVFFYFALLGQLAFVIGHSVNARPMQNDVRREPKIADKIKE